MGVVGNLEIVVSAETSTFDGKLDHVKNKVTTLGTVVRESSRGLHMMGKAFLVAEAGASALRLSLAYLSGEQEKIEKAWTQIPVIGQYFEAAFGFLEDYGGLTAAKEAAKGMEEQIEIAKKTANRQKQLQDIISGVSEARGTLGMTGQQKKVHDIYRFAEEKKKAFKAIIDSMRDAGELRFDVATYNKNLEAALKLYVNDAIANINQNELESKLKKIMDFRDSIQRQIDTFGMSSSRAQLYELFGNNATGKDYGELSKLVDKYDSMVATQEEFERQTKAIKTLHEATMTPMEKFNSILDTYSFLTKIGTEGTKKHADAMELYGRAVKYAWDQVKGLSEVGKVVTSSIGGGGLFGRTFGQFYDSPALRNIAANTAESARNSKGRASGSMRN